MKGGKRNKIKWTKTMDKMVGTNYDPAVAGKLGISTQAVYMRREELEIPTFRETRKKAAIPYLNKMTCKQLREKFGLGAGLVVKLRKEIKDADANHS